jgi:hypothetical protein
MEKFRLQALMAVSPELTPLRRRHSPMKMSSSGQQPPQFAKTVMERNWAAKRILWFDRKLQRSLAIKFVWALWAGAVATPQITRLHSKDLATSHPEVANTPSSRLQTTRYMLENKDPLRLITAPLSPTMVTREWPTFTSTVQIKDRIPTSTQAQDTKTLPAAPHTNRVPSGNSKVTRGPGDFRTPIGTQSSNRAVISLESLQR